MAADKRNQVNHNELFNVKERNARRSVSFFFNTCMNNLRICTWNSQGNPYSPGSEKKLNVLQELYNNNDVLLIQECGDIKKKFNLPFANFLVGKQMGTDYNRCNLCLISKSAGDGQVLEAKSSTGRSAIHLEIEGVHIYTLHATSGNGLYDVMTLFRSAQEPFIIGGDMNCTRFDILNTHGVSSSETNYVFSGTRSRPDKLGELITSDRLTHPGSGHELDFFIVSLSLRTHSTRIHWSMGGDHYPVCTVITEYGDFLTQRRRRSVEELL